VSQSDFHSAVESLLSDGRRASLLLNYWVASPFVQALGRLGQLANLDEAATLLRLFVIETLERIEDLLLICNLGYLNLYQFRLV
jgi:hypothetical protein